MPTYLRSKRALGAVLIVLVGIAGLVTWTLWPDEPRQREYLDATACLLTDENGIVAGPAQSVWTALLQASDATLVKVQYLQVNGPQTADNAGAYLASLTGGQCGAIIAVGPAQIAAVTAAAAAHPTVRFVNVGGGSGAANVQTLDAGFPEALRSALGQRLEELADAAS